MLTNNDLAKYHEAAERILDALAASNVSITWRDADKYALQSVIAKELILIDKEERG